MKYPDTVRVIETKTDGYGDRVIKREIGSAAVFVKRAGYTHGSNTEGETSSATVYLDPKNPRILAIKDDLEGMYVWAEPYSSSTWYRITNVNVAERKLLNNVIDNIYCQLEKVAGIAYAYIS